MDPFGQVLLELAKQSPGWVGLIIFVIVYVYQKKNGNGKDRKSLTEADVVSILAGQRQAERQLQEDTEWRAQVLRDLATIQDPEWRAEMIRAFEDVMRRELAPIRQDIRQLKRGDVA
jgi:hypothetical protein